MRMLTIHSLVAALLMIGAVDADKPDIQFPPEPEVKVKPVPPVTDGLIRLKAEEDYVFDSNTPVLVVASPEGVLTVVEELGPIRIRGRFYGGNGVPESRLFQRKQVFIISGRADSEGKSAELLIFPEGAKKKDQIIRRTFVVGGDKKVDPTPINPKVDPVPDNPAPIPEDGFRVLIVYETSELSKYKEAQRSILFSGPFRTYLDDVCVSGTGGRKEWRIWDKDISGLENESKTWQNAMKLERKSLPWIVISNGKTGTSEALPGTLGETLGLIQKYAPKK